MRLSGDREVRNEAARRDISDGGHKPQDYVFIPIVIIMIFNGWLGWVGFASLAGGCGLAARGGGYCCCCCWKWR